MSESSRDFKSIPKRIERKEKKHAFIFYVFNERSYIDEGNVVKKMDFF